MNDNNSSKALAVLNIIAESPGISQRQVAKLARISLGMANIILKRLAKTGHIKISNLTARRMEYILTPKGISEKTKQTYNYIVNTISTYRELKNRITELVKTYIEKGHKKFAILGKDGVADITELILHDHNKDSGLSIRRISSKDIVFLTPDTLILDCRYGNTEANPGISILSELIKISPQNGLNGRLPLTEET